MPRRDDPDDDDAPIRQHRRPNYLPWILGGGLLAGLAILAVAAVGVAVTVALVRQPAQPAAVEPPAEIAKRPTAVPGQTPPVARERPAPKVSPKPRPQPIPAPKPPPAAALPPGHNDPGNGGRMNANDQRPAGQQGGDFRRQPAADPPPPALPDLAGLVPPTDLKPSEPRPKGESPAVPGYFARRVSGFTLLISRMSYDRSDELGGLPLGYVEAEMARIADLFPERTLTTLRRVPVWVEWDHAVPGQPRAVGIYHGDVGESLLFDGLDPRKSKAVVVMSLKRAYVQRSQGWRGMIVLHEMAHAVHDAVLGLDSAVVRNAFEQAETRELYRQVRYADGSVRDGYAITNKAEYFAELSRAYLDVLDYHPTDRAGLRDYDPAGYELMERVWGTPSQIAAWKAEDAKKAANSKKK